MTTRKRPLEHEPLLNSVARKLGHAACTLTKVTQELTENLSALPGTVSLKVREAANLASPSGGPPSRPRRLRTRKTAQAKKVKVKIAAGANKRRSPKRKPSRKGPRR
jgi:hypothetical protein